MIDHTYRNLLDLLLEQGSVVQTRNSVCRRFFGLTFTFENTPLVGVRKTPWRTALREMEWFLGGGNQLDSLHPSVHPWWEPFTTEGGVLPYSYGEQFRNYGCEVGGFDQIAYLIDGITNYPFSRRNVITTWHTAQMASGLCNPTNCHGSIIQAFVEPEPDKKSAGDIPRSPLTLHLVTYQRSADVMVGLPCNWIQYWGLLLWLAQRTGRTPGTLTWTGGDIHLYETHNDLALRIVKAAPPREIPNLLYRPTSDTFLAEDFSLDRPYNPVLTERAEMIV